MATVKIRFRASANPGKAGTLCYQLIHNRVVRQISTDYRLYPDEWDTAGSRIVMPAGCDDSRERYLSSVHEGLMAGMSCLSGIIGRLERSGRQYHADRVVELYRSYAGDCGFISFANGLIGRMSQIGKDRTAARYATSISSFSRFRRECDVPIGSMDSGLMSEYEQWLRNSGVCRNTSSFYMRNLRAIYNRAVDGGLAVQRMPFRHVYTGIDKTVKRALSAKAIREIRNLDLSRWPQLDYARDLFMFSFYTRGMSFIDMAFLRKKDLHGGILSYRRKKTSQLLFVKWEAPML